MESYSFLYFLDAFFQLIVLYCLQKYNDTLIWQIKENSNVNNLKFIINAQYLRDLSFENPSAPDSLRNFTSNPTFKVDIDVKSRTKRSWTQYS